MESAYTPKKIKTCSFCDGAGVVIKRQSFNKGSYEPSSLERCPICKGAGVEKEK